MSWYIDRSINMASIFSSDWYPRLVTYAQDESQVGAYAKKSREFCSYLGIPGKNPYAVLTCLRDHGLINEDNDASAFFKCAIEAGLTPQEFIILLLLKRNDNKNGESTIKPFVVLSKAFSMMHTLKLTPTINWRQCIEYLMPITNYADITELLIENMCADDRDNPSTGPDIWFNALISTGFFSGRNNEITLLPSGIKLIQFIANYGEELVPNKNRSEYTEQLEDPLYGIYTLFKNHPFETTIALGEMVQINHYIKLVNAFDNNAEVVANNEQCERKKNAQNIILYGVPGAGKSWTIKNEYCNNVDLMERIVFHPDYTYSDFVGQILPKVDVDGSVKYIFTPGPFTKLLKKAFNNPSEYFYLIIEEINRGNAPAIFGDVFQLLDRNTEGGSEYNITNAEVADVVYGDTTHKVSIPSNMYILATMNTSDQNVFTLDTAFQRRWSMRLIKNKFGTTREERAFADTTILDTSVTWEKFFTEINKLILSKNIRMTSSEDKRLGTHFISKEDLVYDGDAAQLRRFPEKVLKYLWDDAFKFTKEDIFDLEKVGSLEDVIDAFISSSGNERFKVFKENIIKALV